MDDLRRRSRPADPAKAQAFLGARAGEQWRYRTAGRVVAAAAGEVQCKIRRPDLVQVRSGDGIGLVFGSRPHTGFLIRPWLVDLGEATVLAEDLTTLRFDAHAPSKPRKPQTFAHVGPLD